VVERVKQELQERKELTEERTIDISSWSVSAKCVLVFTADIDNSLDNAVTLGRQYVEQGKERISELENQSQDTGASTLVMPSVGEEDEEE
jgi:hypothetical protein